MSAAQRHMAGVLQAHVKAATDRPILLNAGAGQSASFEDGLERQGLDFVADRVDIDDCSVERAYVGECWRCSVDAMDPVPSDRFDAVFANYLLEHVQQLQEAASEFHRVLKPGGLLVTTVPNTRAPEFVVSRHTPLAFHEWVRGGQAWETEYAYGSLAELVRIFLAAGFVGQDLRRSSDIATYTRRFPVVRHLGRAYDRVVTRFDWRFLMGQACLVMRKPE